MPRDQKTVELFGSLFCPYSNQAKKLLTEKGIDFMYREIVMAFGWKLPLPNYLEMKRRSGGRASIPQIFISGEYYGDEERLFADDGAGRLEELFFE